jgi:hypothetical protein
MHNRTSEWARPDSERCRKLQEIETWNNESLRRKIIVEEEEEEEEAYITTKYYFKLILFIWDVNPMLAFWKLRTHRLCDWECNGMNSNVKHTNAFLIIRIGGNGNEENCRMNGKVALFLQEYKSYTLSTLKQRLSEWLLGYVAPNFYFYTREVSVSEGLQAILIDNLHRIS